MNRQTLLAQAPLAPVDMGLSVKWSSVNIGANNPQDAGNYYSWGEVEPKEDYSWSTYAHMTDGRSDPHGINKYQTETPHRYERGNWLRADEPREVWYDYDNNMRFIGDNKRTLEAVDDVATQCWGSEWRIPTIYEWIELYNNTTQELTDNYNGTGVGGCILTSTVEGHTDAFIFLPAVGRREGRESCDDGYEGDYWSSSLHYQLSYYVYCVTFWVENDIFQVTHDFYGSRKLGLPVRPVWSENNGRNRGLIFLNNHPRQKTGVS